MSWKQTINIKIAERPYPIEIKNEEEEERIRKAGKLVDDKVFRFMKKYSNQDVQDFLAIAALQFAVKTVELEAKASSTEQADKLKQLDEQLDIFLEQCSDC